ncbi:hypothetical protein NDU88_006541 [Pleurodeles waltl]|uniref:Uncharacterized protein n=1 Tax=Pleurodeles waltl TaxID=8319 RepID=A0AAV7ULB5_PLEWA|nr:hypothetical protein NDU88_006541 [Pleurodeles waltl]
MTQVKPFLVWGKPRLCRMGRGRETCANQTLVTKKTSLFYLDAPCAETFDAQLVSQREKRRTPTLIGATLLGRSKIRRTASQGQRRPTSRGEIDATPAVRS